MDLPLTFHYLTFALIIMSTFMEKDEEDFPIASMNANYVEDTPIPE